MGGGNDSTTRGRGAGGGGTERATPETSCADAPARGAALDAGLLSLGPDVYLVIGLGEDAAELPASLTAAERDVAVAALQGLSNAAIAHARAASPRTIANQLSAVYRKLGVGSRAAFAARYGRRGSV